MACAGQGRLEARRGLGVWFEGWAGTGETGSRRRSPAYAGDRGVALRDVAKEESIRLEVFTGWEAKVGGVSGGVRLLRIQEGPGGPPGTGGEGPRGPRC